jgi:hypothetical protein
MITLSSFVSQLKIKKSPCEENGPPQGDADLFNLLQPLGSRDPFVIDPVIPAIILNLAQEIVQPVEEIRIALRNGPGQRFKRERFVQKD